MSGEKGLLDYFIRRTDERFDALEAKIDQLLRFKWQIIGGSLVASAVITVLFDIALAVFRVK